MEKRIKLKDIVSEMDMISNAINYYLNIQTGKIVMVTDENKSYAEYEAEEIAKMADWEQEQIKTAQDVLFTKNYIQLPSQYDIHEYNIMQDFCEVLSNKRIANELSGSLSGKGAHRNFKDKIFHHGLRDDYYEFREIAFYDIAREWCEENNIKYENDTPQSKKTISIGNHLVEKIEGIGDLPMAEIKTVLRGADPLIASAGRATLGKLLNGSKAKKILKMGLDTCPAYGCFSHLSEAEIMLKIDWVIQQDYLTTEMYDRFPLLVFTPKGWEIEKNTFADEFLADFENILKKGVPFDMSHLKDRNRDIIFLLLEKIRNSNDRRFIFLLEAWFKIDYKKVKQRIHSVIKSLENV